MASRTAHVRASPEQAFLTGNGEFVNLGASVGPSVQAQTMHLQPRFEIFIFSLFSSLDSRNCHDPVAIRIYTPDGQTARSSLQFPIIRGEAPRIVTRRSLLFADLDARARRFPIQLHGASAATLRE